MKKLRLFMGVIALMLATFVNAAVGSTFTIDDLTYTVLTENADNTTGTVSVKAKNKSIAGAIIIPESVRQDVNGVQYSYTVTRIAKDAFYNCPNVSTIEIPNSVTELVEQSFRCSYFKTVDLPTSITTIPKDCFGNSEIETITLPSSITTIADRAFRSCSKLTTVVLPENLTELKDYTFQDCSSLADITFNEHLQKIGSSVFYNCTSLTEITFPASITTIKGAFYGCVNVKKLTINAVNPTISANTFKWFGTIDNPCILIVPDDFVFDDDNTFDGNTDVDYFKYLGGYFCTPDHVGGSSYTENGVIYSFLTKDKETKTGTCSIKAESVNTSGDIVIPEILSVNGYDYTVVGIEVAGFANCTNITSMTLPNTVENISSKDFKDCTGLTSFVVQNSDNSKMKAINNSAFQGCTALTSIIIPNSVETIASTAFQGCTSLQSVTLSENLKLIDDWAFAGCSSLVSITLPAKMKNLGKEVFSGCSSLEEVYIPASLTTINYGGGGDATQWDKTYGYSFANCPNLTRIIIDENNENWGDFGQNCIINKNTKILVQGSIGTLEIPSFAEKIGERAFEGQINRTNINIPSNIIEIGESAFQNCTSLENIIFESGLQKIGARAFANCTSIEKLTLPESLEIIGTEAFENTSILEIDFPTTLKTVEADAFKGAVKKIHTNAYDTNVVPGLKINIHNLKSWCNVDFKSDYSNPARATEDVWTYANYYLNGEKIVNLTIPADVEIIKNYAFINCTSIQTLVVNANLTQIGCKAFYENYALRALTFNGSCAEIMDCAFTHNNISVINIPDGCTHIGESAFQQYRFDKIGGPIHFVVEDEYDLPSYCKDKQWGVHLCADREFVRIPSSVKSIGVAAFFGDGASINELHIEGTGLESIGALAFHGCAANNLYIDDLEWWCATSFEDSSIRDFEGYIRDNFHNKIYYTSLYSTYDPAVCFRYTSEPMNTVYRTTVNHNFYVNGELITKLVIPEGVTKIPAGKFCGFDCLESVIIPSTVTEIGEGAFLGCNGMRVIKIPNSVTTIGNCAFMNMDQINHITLPTYVSTIGEDVVAHYTGYDPITYKNGSKTEITIPAEVTSLAKIQSGANSNSMYNPGIKHFYIMDDEIPAGMANQYKNIGITIYVKPSVFAEKYSSGEWNGFAVTDQVPLSMTNASGNPIEYKTMCRDFDVDFTHTNDNLPEGVEPLRVYLVEDVDGELRMVFLNEIKYIPSRLKANVTDGEGNLYKGVDEYVGVIVRGTPGYCYNYEIGEHDYTQGAEGQWLMEDAMAYSGATYEGNLMAGTANDDEYVFMKKDDLSGEIINYGLNNGRFKIYHKDGWLTYNKSYLQLPKNVSAAIEGNTDAEGNANLTFVFNNADGTTDKVSSVEFNRNCESDIFYNPYGQRVNANTKGIVIKNGKKYVNK